MDRQGLTEAEALRALRSASMNTRCPMIQVALELLEDPGPRGPEPATRVSIGSPKFYPVVIVL